MYCKNGLRILFVQSIFIFLIFMTLMHTLYLAAILVLCSRQIILKSSIESIDKKYQNYQVFYLLNYLLAYQRAPVNKYMYILLSLKISHHIPAIY